MSEGNSRADRALGIAENLAGNKLLLYGVGGVLLVIAIYLAAAGFRAWVKETFGAIFDGLAAIVPKPESQQAEQRSTGDLYAGIVHEGDRALSDWVDIFTLEGTGELTPYAKQRLAEQQAQQGR